MARVVMSPGWEDRLQNETMDTKRELARDVAADIRQNIRAGRHVQTGALVRSVRIRRAGFSYHVFIGTDHWWTVEYGSPPHEIRAPAGHVLRFVKPNGEIVYTMRIRHPGNPAYRVVRRAVFKKRSVRRA